MEPMNYLEEAAKNADEHDNREEINRVIDELELIYEALDPEFQDLAADLISRLSGRLKGL
jgi:hypothetical protein